MFYIKSKILLYQGRGADGLGFTISGVLTKATSIGVGTSCNQFFFFLESDTSIFYDYALKIYI